MAILNALFKLFNAECCCVLGARVLESGAFVDGFETTGEIVVTSINAFLRIHASL